MIISHRFSTVRNADRIYVIRSGKIIERGSHQELIQKRVYMQITLENRQKDITKYEKEER